MQKYNSIHLTTPPPPHQRLGLPVCLYASGKDVIADQRADLLSVTVIDDFTVGSADYATLYEAIMQTGGNVVTTDAADTAASTNDG